jgi:phage FluMu protein Com
VAVGQCNIEEYGKVEDGTLVVTRKCPHCGRLNQGRVTRTVGKPLESRNALDGPWRCTDCGRSLGKVDAI